MPNAIFKQDYLMEGCPVSHPCVMVSVRNICILQVIVENGNVERTNPPVSSCSSLMHPEGNIPLEINPEFSFTICRNQLSERFLMGDYREKLPFPITENIIGAGFLIGNNRPTPVLRHLNANVRFRESQRSSRISQKVRLKLGKLQFYH